MTDMPFSTSPRALRLTSLPRPEPLLMRIALAMVLCMALTLPALLIDDRMFQGDSVWLKPIKFQIALALFFVTLAVVAGWLPQEMMRSRRMRRYLALVGAATTAEMIWICGAAMFATASHYNTQTVMSVIYPAMGVVAIFLTSASLVLGLAFWRGHGLSLPPAFRLSLALGLILTFVLTVIAAGTLASPPGHFIGTPVTGAKLPILGWSREVGDLRVAHFLATHALHAVPLAGLAALLLGNARASLAVVWAAAAGYAGLTLLTLVQALNGLPVF